MLLECARLLAVFMYQRVRFMASRSLFYFLHAVTCQTYEVNLQVVAYIPLYTTSSFVQAEHMLAVVTYQVCE
jgi:hypothetical protein